MVNILRISSISDDSFYDEFVVKSRPVILSNIVSQWKGFDTWTLSSFADKYGNKKTGVIRLKSGIQDVNTFSESLTNSFVVREAISSILKGIDHTEMVIASPTSAFCPEIKEDVDVPSYCKQGRFLRSRIYIGPKGLTTPLHQDLPENLYAVVRGKKQISIYCPADRKYLYPNSFFSKNPNFSRFNPDSPDFEKFPLAHKAKPITISLEAGEVLYIPSLWWHHIRNSEDSIALNFWWSVGWKTAIAWGAASYKRIFHFRN